MDFKRAQQEIAEKKSIAKLNNDYTTPRDILYRNSATRFKNLKNGTLVKAILKVYESEIDELINADLKLIADARTLDLPDKAHDLLEAHLLLLDAITKRVQQEIADLIKQKHEGFENECPEPGCSQPECLEDECSEFKCLLP